jgi:hypothetical protein
MAGNIVSVTKLTIYDDDVSVSAYDDNITDMLDMDLYTHGWKLVGTSPPSVRNHEYFHMKFIEPTDNASDDDIVDASLLLPMDLKHTDDVLVELIPMDKRTLGYAYDYFKNDVSRGVKGDLLVTMCKSVYKYRDPKPERKVYKSPVFDVPGCTVVIPARSDFSKEMFTAIETERGPGILFIPMVITDMIMDNLDDIGIRVMPSPQDMWSYSSCRTRVSKWAVACDFDSSDWKGTAYAAEFSRRLPCSAVATATLTVSVLLEPWQYSHGKHTSKYCMTYIVHAVK